MNDPEFRQMVNKAIFIISVVVVFAIPVFFIFKNKIIYTESELLKSINKKTILLYITENNCKLCKTYRKELDKNNIKYKELNKDKEQDYESIINKLELNNSNLYVPALIYIKDGEVQSFIVDIKTKKILNEYIENYK